MERNEESKRYLFESYVDGNKRFGKFTLLVEPFQSEVPTRDKERGVG